ncbi:hypothetical protein EVAR_64527_1 [Eumeta japonica]|uniref:Uncharacterized protein n=1 Tax=Eumeta variegata TaxID=151549 RepID=A0A4C1ZG14_EUMVA|nr:hypothetical protein EVAR_64527_1 [Eumeta japonica]
MAAQVEHDINQSRAARSVLRSVLRLHFSLLTTVALYKDYIHSRLTYAALAWYALCSTSQRKRIQTQQNIALPSKTKNWALSVAYACARSITPM